MRWELVKLRVQAWLQPQWCRCHHPRDYHEHYRAGSDCGLCPCPRFRGVRE